MPVIEWRAVDSGIVSVTASAARPRSARIACGNRERLKCAGSIYLSFDNKSFART